MLVLHIGLPKTGTTFLQQRVFAKASGIFFIHRRRGEAEAAVCSSLRRLAHTRFLAPMRRRRVVACLRALPDPGSRPILVSDENISLSSTEFWRGGGAGPERLARRLAALATALGQPVRVILGVRRQDQWLASRYAESSKQFERFGQADFDRRASGIASAPTLAGPLAWLDYAAARAALVAGLGPDNVLVLPLERLAAAPDAAVAEIGDFFGIDLTPPAKRAKRPRNVLSVEENAWRLRRDGAPLRLAPELGSALRARFATSNRALAAHLPLGFEP